MKILAVLCRDPARQGGGASYAILASLELLSRQHSVAITGFGACFESPGVAGYPSVGSLGSVTNSRGAFLWCLLTGKSFTKYKYSRNSVKQKLREFILKGRFDCVWFEQAQAGFSADVNCLRSLPTKPCLVLRSHNIESKVVGFGVAEGCALVSYLFTRESRALEREETSLWRQMDAIAAISAEDRTWINATLPDSQGRAIYLPVSTSALPPKRTTGSKRERGTLLFIGDCAWRPNRDAAVWISEELAPLLSALDTTLRLILVGRGTDIVAAKYSTDVVRGLGYVENVDGVYESSFCVLAPMQTGSGVNIKVLEALRWGIPVIGSCFGRRGLSSSGYLVAESAEDYIHHLRQMCTDDEYYSELRKSAMASHADGNRLAEEAIEGLLLSATAERSRRVN